MRPTIFREKPMPSFTDIDIMLAIINEARSALALRQPNSLDTDMLLITLIDLNIFPRLTSYYQGLDKNQQRRFNVKWKEWMITPLVTVGDLDLANA